MSAQAIPYIIALGFLFGSTLIASRFSVGQFEPSTYIGIRLVLASLGHMIIYAISGRIFPRDKGLWRKAVLLGIIGTALPMTFIVSSLQYISSGLAAILLTTNPAVTALAAHFLLSDEKLTYRKSIAVGMALTGAILLALQGETGLSTTDGNIIGYLMMGLSILIGSLSAVFVRSSMRDYQAFDVASIRMWAAGLTVLPLSMIFIGFDLSEVTSAGYGALGYASLAGTFGGLMLSIYIIQRFGALAGSLASYVMPIVAAVGGWLILDEQITTNMIIGMAIIMLGITLLSEGKINQAPAEQPMPEQLHK